MKIMTQKVDCICCPFFKLKTKYCRLSKSDLTQYFDNNIIYKPTNAKTYKLYLDPPITCKIRSTEVLVRLMV